MFVWYRFWVHFTLTGVNYSHIFLQLCTGGDLFTYITSHPSLKHHLCEAEAKYIMYQLLRGLDYLHEHMISHRGACLLDVDPRFSILMHSVPYPCRLEGEWGLYLQFLFLIVKSKPENILLHSPGPYPRILIADFGLARPNAHQETFNVCGTVSYLPPEGVLALDVKHLGYVG